MYNFCLSETKLPNLKTICGLPTVGKSHLFNKIISKNKLYIPYSEDNNFLTFLNSKLGTNFSNINEYASWRKNNRRKIEFLYKKYNGTSFITQLYNQSLYKQLTYCENNRNSHFLFDLGGYQFNTNILDFGTNFYIRFDSFDEFYFELTKRYKEFEDFITIIPFFNNNLIKATEDNILCLYKNMDSYYLENSNVVFKRSYVKNNFEELYNEWFNAMGTK